jgi:hypothetical protein
MHGQRLEKKKQNLMRGGVVAREGDSLATALIGVKITFVQRVHIGGKRKLCTPS